MNIALLKDKWNKTGLFHYLQVRFRFWLGHVIAASCARRRLLRIATLKHQTLAVFLGEYANDRYHRHHEIEGCTAKTPVASDHLVAHFQVAHRTRAEIQHTFAILDESLRHK